MNIKRKLILIGICVAAILIIFGINVFRGVKEKPGKEKEEALKENVISKAEAYRLLSYLDYGKPQRETLPTGIKYADQSMSDWYDTYVNAVCKMGLIGENVTESPGKALTYGACKEIIDKLITNKPEYQNVYRGLSFEFVKSEDEMTIEDFLQLYEVILAQTPADTNPIKEKTLFVLGREVSEDGKDRMVTDLGKYYSLDARSYEGYYEKMNQSAGADKDTSTDGITPTDAGQTDTSKAEITGRADDAQKAAAGNASMDGGTQETLEQKDVLPEAERLTGDRISNLYLDKGIRVLIRDQEIIYITSTTTEKIVLHNVWIKSGADVKVDTFINGMDKSFTAKSPLSSSIEKVVGDIAVEDKKIIQISVKPDMIRGKVLQLGDDFIEIEGYGKVPLDEGYRIYKIYGDLTLEPTGSILVGYDTTDFVVSGGKISAALITEEIKAENIRVLLKTTDFSSIYHDKVEFTSDSDFVVSSKDKKTPYKAGDIVTVAQGDDLLSQGRIKVETASDQGKIQLLSIVRSSKNPKYRGSIEISEGEEGLLIVNELPLEEYLYAVIPSEMPTYYGNEALKVQAVCARSYAYKHLMANSLSSYGAHVDDSVSYQVYNNISENEESILAVKDTYGKVIESDGKVITAYYFSTSCGHTEGVENVWANGEPTSYLSGKLMAVEEEGDGSEEQLEGISLYKDLSKDKTFRSFIDSTDFKTYDSGFDWYRWKVTINKDDIKASIDQNLAKRYKANPDLILTMTSPAEGDKKAVFESVPVETVGEIEKIKVSKRSSGGIITELLITGSEHTIKVKTEYNIRVFLSPAGSTLIRQDQSKVSGIDLLPSAFFYIDREEADGKLTGFTLHGGGYGHGVGMSQNGVKALSDAGKRYEEILSYFYEGTKLGFIYDLR